MNLDSPLRTLHVSAVAGALALSAAACSGAHADESSADTELAASSSVAIPADLIPVPFVRQQTDYSCGDVATLAVLRYWKNAEYKQVPETALYAPLHTSSKDGTDPQPIADYLNGAANMVAEYRSDATVAELVRALDRGEPVIVDLQAWQDPKRPWADDWDDGHYVVLVGKDARNFYFMDPSTGRHYAYIPRAELAERWHDVVGADNARTQHMAIFVQPTETPFVPTHALPPTATPIQ